MMSIYGWIIQRAAICIGLSMFALSVQSAVTKPDPEIDSIIETQEWVRVIVMFKPAEGSALSKKLPDIQQMDQITNLRQQIMVDAPGQLISKREFLLVPGFAAEVDATTLKWLKSHPLVEHIELDVPGSGHMAEGGVLANIPDVFSAGLTGTGVKVAIVDSGIDTDHPDFAGRLVGQQCFCSGGDGATGCCPNGLETESGEGAAEDGNGHGTNVAGILAGGGTVALRGAAPGAEIVAVRVLANNNSFCCLSDVVAGFDWVRVHHPDASVLNASLGTSALYAGSCDSEYSAMSAAVNNLVANGTMVFVSSGNQGSSTEMASPACISKSISVGAVWDTPRSPTTTLGCTDTNITTAKPTCFTNSNDTLDIYAPGAVITSSGRGGGTSSYSGTSMASPMTAGCAASLRGWQPQASIEEIEAALKASLVTVTDSKNNLVFPLLDCLDAKNRIGNIYIPFVDGFEN